MVKVINIFRKIENLDSFEEHFFSDLLPAILNSPGILGIKVTSIKPMSQELSQDVEGIQLIIENYYESQEAIDKTVHSEIGQQLMEYASKLPGELSVFVGQEKIFSPKLIQNYYKNRG